MAKIQENKNIAKAIFKKIYQSELSESETYKVLEYTIEKMLSNNFIQGSEIRLSFAMINKIINSSIQTTSENLNLTFAWAKSLTNKMRKNTIDVFLFLIKFIAKRYSNTKLLSYVKNTLNDYFEVNKEYYDDYEDYINVKTGYLKIASDGGADNAFKYELKNQFQMQLEKLLKEFEITCLDYINNIENNNQNPRKYNIERHWKSNETTLDDFYKKLRMNLKIWILEKKKEN